MQVKYEYCTVLKLGILLIVYIIQIVRSMSCDFFPIFVEGFVWKKYMQAVIYMILILYADCHIYDTHTICRLSYI